jgi:hypothetical protein
VELPLHVADLHAFGLHLMHAAADRLRQLALPQVQNSIEQCHPVLQRLKLIWSQVTLQPAHGYLLCCVVALELSCCCTAQPRKVSCVNTAV